MENGTENGTTSMSDSDFVSLKKQKSTALLREKLGLSDSDDSDVDSKNSKER